MDRLVTKIDIYEEIASVCPMQCDLKSMSTEEMTVKISQYNSKLEQMNEAISDEEGSAEELDNKFDHEDSFQEMGYLHMRSIYDLSCVNTDKSIMSLFDHEEDPCDSDGQI